jgi:hypothetical protein
MGGACSTCGGRRVLYRVLVGKPEVKRPLWRPRRIWENNIKMDLQEVGGGGAVVKVLRYKSQGRWFDSRWCHWNFSLTLS